MSGFDDYRHVDVAILYGLGMEDRAQHLARKLRRPKCGVLLMIEGDQNGITNITTCDDPGTFVKRPESVGEACE